MESEHNMVGARIRDARERAQLTQAKLAEKLGVHRASIGLWESGRVLPRSTARVRDILRVDEFFLPRDRGCAVSDMSDSELAAHLNVLVAQVNEVSVEIARRLNRQA
jgi:DNA-binding XRE family transcriptional regulator